MQTFYYIKNEFFLSLTIEYSGLMGLEVREKRTQPPLL